MRPLFSRLPLYLEDACAFHTGHVNAFDVITRARGVLWPGGTHSVEKFIMESLIGVKAVLEKDPDIQNHKSQKE